MKRIKRSLLTTFFLAAAAVSSTANAATDVNTLDDIKNVLNSGANSSVRVASPIAFNSQLDVNSDFTISAVNGHGKMNVFSADALLNETAIDANDSTLTLENLVFETFKHGILSSSVNALIKTDNTILRNSNKDGNGGAIDSAGIIDIRNSTFTKILLKITEAH